MNKKYISLFILTIGLINPVFADRGGGGDFHSGGGGFHDNEFHAGGGGFHGGDRLYSGNRVYAGDRFYGGDRVYGGDRFYGGGDWGGYDRGWGGFGGWGGGGFWDGIVGGLAGTWLIGSLFTGWGNNNYNNGGGYYGGGSGGGTTNNYYDSNPNQNSNAYNQNDPYGQQPTDNTTIVEDGSSNVGYWLLGLGVCIFSALGFALLSRRNNTPRDYPADERYVDNRPRYSDYNNSNPSQEPQRQRIASNPN